MYDMPPKPTNTRPLVTEGKVVAVRPPQTVIQKKGLTVGVRPPTTVAPAKKQK